MPADTPWNLRLRDAIARRGLRIEEEHLLDCSSPICGQRAPAPADHLRRPLSTKRDWITDRGRTHRHRRTARKPSRRQAARNRSFASSLLKAADLLGPPGPAEIALVRKAIDEALGVESGYERDPRDIAVAGYRLAEELELLAERPATRQALEVAEEAIDAWDGHLYAVLSQDYRTDETEPSDIGGRIAAAHLAICTSLRPDPEQLAADLVRLEGLAEIESSIDALGAYRHLLGPTSIAAYKGGIRQLQRARGW